MKKANKKLELLHLNLDPKTYFFPKLLNNDFNIYKAHSGFSIETQYMPNDINMYGAKAQSILEADTLFTSKTSFQIHEK